MPSSSHVLGPRISPIQFSGTYFCVSMHSIALQITGNLPSIIAPNMLPAAAASPYLLIGTIMLTSIFVSIQTSEFNRNACEAPLNNTAL